MAFIVWDCDDVLNDLMRCWFQQWWKPAHPRCKLSYENLSENPPHRVLGASLEEYLASLDEFRLSDQAAEMKPVPEVLAWFKQYGHQHRHMALTATPLDTAPVAAAWTLRHFGAWVRSFHLVPSPRDNQPIIQDELDKGEYLYSLGKGNVLVDDSPANLEAARQYGVVGVLIPRPWNRDDGSIGEALERLTGLMGGL